MNLKIFVRTASLFFLSVIMVFATNPSFAQDTVKKPTTPGNTAPAKADKPAVQGTPGKAKQPVILRAGEKPPAGKEQDPLKQYSKKEFSGSSSKPGKSIDPNEMKAEELFHSGSRKGSQGDYEGAVADLTKSLNYKKDGDTYLKRALAYIMTDKYTSAVAD